MAGIGGLIFIKAYMMRHSFPEVAHDRCVGPGMFCVEAGFAVGSDNYIERLVEPENRQMHSEEGKVLSVVPFGVSFPMLRMMIICSCLYQPSIISFPVK